MFEEVKEMIDSTVYTNGRGEVTAQNVNLAMHGIVDANEEKFSEVEENVTTLGDKVTALEENGIGGGAGALKVWMPTEDISTELTPEQIAENVATYNEIVKGEPVSVVLCQGESNDRMTIAGTIPTTASYTDFGGNKTVALLANQFISGEMVVIMGQLSSDGSVAMTTETFELPAPSGVVFYTTNTGEVSEEQKAKNVAAFNKYAAGIPVSVIANYEGHEATYYPFAVVKDEASELSYLACCFPVKVSNGDDAEMLFYEDGSVVMQTW